jgi:hypothetical protein
MKFVAASALVMIGISPAPALAEQAQIDEIVKLVCPADNAYKNLASVTEMRERAGKDFDTVAPLCLAYNEGWTAGWEARETRSVSVNYNDQCRALLLQEIRGSTGAIAKFASSISSNFARLAFIEHCQTYKDGFQAGMELARDMAGN